MKSHAAKRSNDAVYVLGLDFGTLSGRAVLVDAGDGREVATAEHEYARGVIERNLPGDKKRLPPDTALQDPADYLKVLSVAVPEVLRAAKVKADQVAGIGVDFTACTILPTDAAGKPLCFQGRFKRQPHAWVKLWKHHAAQPEADAINAAGRRRKEPFIQAYGGKYSSEWFFSKVLETVRRAPGVFRAADRILEAGDWLVWQLVGEERRSVSAAGFKAMRVVPAGKPSLTGSWRYPDRAFFRALDPRLEDVASKMGGEPLPLAARAGGLTRAMARRTGLNPGTPVATANIDAHAAVPACGATRPGDLVMIMGTSTCHMLVSDQRREVEGMCGVVANGVIPGFWGYEAGQAGVGDLFAWFMEHGVPGDLQREADRKRTTPYALLGQQAASLAPGESGMVALDWWNGNRSVLVDADLTGLLIGATIGTRPHEIYRTLMEATAFGTRKIIEAFTGRGIAVDRIVGCGGLAKKNPLLMQIYADVTGRRIHVAESDQASALGAAMHAAVAAGVHRDLHGAARKMARLEKKVYKPNKKHRAVYDALYAEYSRLHDQFGRAADSPMKRLKELRRRVLS